MKTGTELRREALREVENCVCRDRQNTHGPAESNFASIAEFWTTYLRTRGLIAATARIESFDVAEMSGLIKSARAAHNPHHRDNWIDRAGYAICGAGIIARAAEEATAAASAVIGDEAKVQCSVGPNPGVFPSQAPKGVNLAVYGGLTSAEKLRVLADAASPIAAGHNPGKLTEAQVCVEDGWRLLAPAEIRARASTDDIQAWVADERWASFFSGDQRWITYRTKKPPGYFLPKPTSYAEALNAEAAR